MEKPLDPPYKNFVICLSDVSTRLRLGPSRQLIFIFLIESDSRACTENSASNC